jgi:hypothetical protein
LFNVEHYPVIRLQNAFAVDPSRNEDSLLGAERYLNRPPNKTGHLSFRSSVHISQPVDWKGFEQKNAKVTKINRDVRVRRSALRRYQEPQPHTLGQRSVSLCDLWDLLCISLARSAEDVDKVQSSRWDGAIFLMIPGTSCLATIGLPPGTITMINRDVSIRRAGGYGGI